MSKLAPAVRDSLKVNQPFNSFSETNDELASNGTCLLKFFHVKKNNVVTCEVGVFSSLEFGVGYMDSSPYTDYAALWVEVDDTNVKQYRRYSGDAQLISTTPHELTFGSHTIMTMKLGVTEGSLTIFDDKGNSKSVTLQAGGVGRPFVKNLGNSSISVKLSCMPMELTKKIWVFGDSYVDFNSAERWPYYYRIAETTDWFCDAQPGLSPDNAYIDLTNMLSCGFRPSLLVWLLGMNGSTTETQVDGQYVINPSQKTVIDNVVALCNNNNINLVLGIVPTVPDRQKTGFGNYVKSLGVRYIDFAKAVGTDSSGQWTTGLLSSDNVHPTVAGAKVLASQVYIDCPELTIIN
jgi:hypothetical protein